MNAKDGEAVGSTPSSDSLSFSMARMASSIRVRISGRLALAERIDQRAAGGTQEVAAPPSKTARPPPTVCPIRS